MTARVRRTAYTLLYLEDELILDVAGLLAGEPPTSGDTARVVALAVLTGERHRLSGEELVLLMSIPTNRWVPTAEQDPDLVSGLVDKALLVSDSDNAPQAAVRERDEALSVSEWNLHAAAYHYMTQWSGVFIREGVEDEVQLTAESRAAAQGVLAEYGPPPPAFKEVSTAHTLPLPGQQRDGSLYRALMARRTTRSFDTDAPMTLEQLDTVLWYVFGCHGYGKNVADVLCIKRTSPSGGGLHPIEAYPIVSNVTGVTPGIYHYNPGDHELALLGDLDTAECRRMATSFMCGQGYFGVAAVSFVLTARFYRNHWKYRCHQKAYPGILMDAAHLSQTLYLVSADLGLGAFVTLAINGRDIEERLGLDGVTEGVVALTGCGPRAPGESPLEMSFSREPPP